VGVLGLHWRRRRGSLDGRSSDAHGHQDVAVFVFGFWVFGAHLAGGLAVFEFEADFAFVTEGFEEVDHVVGVEADDDGVEGVGSFDAVFGLAGFVGLGADLELVLLETEADGVGAFIGELGDAADGGGELGGADDGEARVIAGHDGFVVGELAGELTARQGAVAYAEEEPEVVVGEFDVFGIGGSEEGLELGESFAGDEDALFAADAFEGCIGLFDVGEAVAVSGYHGDGFGLEDEQGAVEGVAGLFVGDGEDGAADEGPEDGDRNLDRGCGREVGDLGVVGATEADHLGVGASGADLNPMVVEELDGDFAVGEKFDVVVELAGGDGAGAGLFDFGLGGGAEGLVEVGGGDVDDAAIGSIGGFDEEVGEDGDGGLAFDDGLDGGELFEEVLTGDGDLHGCSLGCRCGGEFGFEFQSWHGVLFCFAMGLDETTVYHEDGRGIFGFRSGSIVEKLRMSKWWKNRLEWGYLRGLGNCGKGKRVPRKYTRSSIT